MIRWLAMGAVLVTGAPLDRQDRLVEPRTSRLYDGVTRRFSGALGRDLNWGFEAMSAKVASAVSPMRHGESYRYLSVTAHRLGYSVTEIVHHPQLLRDSKYGNARFRLVLDLLTVRFLMSYEHRPLHLFGGVGFASSVIGGLMPAYPSLLWMGEKPIGDRPLLIAGVLLTIVGLQLLLFGLLAGLIVHTRQRDGRVLS